LTGQSNALTFLINGGRTDQNSWTVDRADNLDRGANLTTSVEQASSFACLGLHGLIPESNLK